MHSSQLYNCICRGDTFRAQYRRVSEVKAVLGNVPVLAATATATQAMINAIGDILGIPDFQVVAKVPDR